MRRALCLEGGIRCTVRLPSISSMYLLYCINQELGRMYSWIQVRTYLSTSAQNCFLCHVSRYFRVFTACCCTAVSCSVAAPKHACKPRRQIRSHAVRYGTVEYFPTSHNMHRVAFATWMWTQINGVVAYGSVPPVDITKSLNAREDQDQND